MLIEKIKMVSLWSIKFKTKLFLCVILIGFVLLGNFIFANFAHASLWSFTVHVNAQTNNFNQARYYAIKNNRKMALENVIYKLVDINNYRKVDKLLDSDSVYFFEDKLKISNETVVNDNYIVDITYFFNQDKVIAFLIKNNIPYTTSLNNKILIIPVLNNSINNNNTWSNLWANTDADDYLSQIQVLSNIPPQDQDKILSFDKDYLQKLQSQYGSNDIIIASLNVVNTAPSMNIIHDTLVSSNNFINNNPQSINLTLKAKDSTHSFKLKVTSLASGNSENYSNIFSLYDARQYTMSFAENSIKATNFKLLEQKNTMVFKVTFKSFIDWVAIYNFLKHTSQIENLYIQEMTSNYVLIKVKYHGNLDDVIKEASNHNIIIDNADYVILCNGFCY